MANELRITDVVDAKAIADLKQLNEHLLQTKDNYVSVVESIGKGIGAPVKGFEDLKNKAKGYEEAMKQLGEAQKQIIAIQGQYTKLLDEVNKKVSARVKEELEASKASLNNAKAETEAAKQRKLNAEAAIKEAKLQQQEAKKQAAAQMSVTDALNNEAKTIAEAAAQNRVLRQAIRELDVTTEDAVKTFELYAAKINANDELMDKFSDNMTARKRNIGNYASAWNGLGMSVQQLARELPALSMGFNTFFLAISNNLPILADEIKRARMEFQAMQAAGEKGVPVWKQLLSSVLSWQTALIVGVTVLSMYGKEIAEWVGNLFKGKKAVDAMAEAEKSLQEAREKGARDSVKERSELDLLYEASQDVTRSIEERNDAIDELQRRYPKYFSNMSNEEIMAGNAAGAYEKLKNSIIATAEARAIQDKIAETSSKILDKEIQQKELESELELAQERLKTEQDLLDKLKGQTDAQEFQSGVVEVVRDRVNEIKNNIQIAKDEITSLNELATFYKGKVNVTDLIGEGYGGSGGGATPFESQLTGNYLDYSYLVHSEEVMKEISDKYEKEREEKRKETIAKNMRMTNETYAWMGVRSQQYMSMELDGLVEQYEKGLIDKEEYEKKKAEITERYAIEQAQMAVDLAKEQLTSGNFTEEERFLLEQEIAKKEIALAEKVRDAKIKATKETTEVIKVSLEDALSYASEALGAIGDLAAAFSERDLQRIEEQEEANEEQYEKDIARIEKLEETGAISKEEAEARKRAAEEQTAAKEKELERKKAEVQERQAKFDKAVSISQAIIATALGILQTIKNVGMPAAIPFIALQSALGAIQLATIIAQPIPKYAKGTKDHKGGLAIVGDGGKREAVFMDGEMYATPDVPTLVNLPKHAVVMPDLSKITSMDGMHSDLLMLMNRKNRMQGDGVVVNVNNDYKRLEKQMDANSSELRQIKKLLKNQHLATDRAMIYNRL